MEQTREAAATAAEEAIALFDAYWFHRLVLLSCSPPALTPAPPPPPPQRGEEQQAPVESKSRELQRAPSGLRHRRSRSDEVAAAAFEGLEPLKIPNSHRARLETILSGKDGLAAPQPLPERRRPEVRRPGGRRRRRRGRSMSELELEFEEVKGLRDLGFTFSDAEVDAELASIFPGLRRRRSEEEAKKVMAATSAEEEFRSDTAAAAAALASAPRRPYLSEAWEEEEEEVRRMLRNLRIPAARDGADLKEHLRLWAHTVASAVR